MDMTLTHLKQALQLLESRMTIPSLSFPIIVFRTNRHTDRIHTVITRHRKKDGLMCTFILVRYYFSSMNA